MRSKPEVLGGVPMIEPLRWLLVRNEGKVEAKFG
jgi:hypothetical protein